MYLNQLLDVSLLRGHIKNGYVMEAFHPSYPLVLYTYGRKTVQENLWDEVTTKTRGLIVNKNTGEIVARPFFKFFNYGQAGMSELSSTFLKYKPTVWEKVDGFLCTLYQYNGETAIASKGSFTSPHAKWATAWYKKHKAELETKYPGLALVWPTGYTPVFEGVTKELRIVVDYKDREELVLLALINTETGEEFDPLFLKMWADQNGFKTPGCTDLTLTEALDKSLTEVPNEEGYVLTWYQDQKPPFRLKLKFSEYLRLHRMVTGMSPKRILEVLENGWTTEMDEMVNNSTPWFAQFVNQWKTKLETEYEHIEKRACDVYRLVEDQLEDFQNEHPQDVKAIRKAFALAFKTEGEGVCDVLFAILDGKDIKPVIWKKVKPLTTGAGPMVDIHNL